MGLGNRCLFIARSYGASIRVWESVTGSRCTEIGAEEYGVMGLATNGSSILSANHTANGAG